MKIKLLENELPYKVSMADSPNFVGDEFSRANRRIDEYLVCR